MRPQNLVFLPLAASSLVGTVVGELVVHRAFFKVL